MDAQFALECNVRRGAEQLRPSLPDFIVELRSSTDRLPPLQVQAKMKQWIANGAEVAWLIDPTRKVVEIYRPGEQPEIHLNPTSVQGPGPIAGFELVMNRIWS
jgi:Uma2 family endonuclease